MKTLKYILLAIVALAGFSACSDDAAEESGINGYGVYFDVDAPQTVYIAEGQNQISVELQRSIAGEAFSTRVLFAPEGDSAEIFNIDSTTATFAADAVSTSVNISFDFNDIESGTKYAMSLSLADETNASSYGRTSYSFVVLFDPWDDLGEATFYDYFFFENGYKVPVQRKSGTTDTFRLVNPYGPGLKAEGADLVNAGLGVGTPSEYLEFVVLENGLVAYDPCTTGLLYQGTSDILICHPYSLGMEDPSQWAYNCELSEGVYQLAPYYYVPAAQGGWDYTQTEGLILIVMPGADLDLSDFSISSEFLGTYTSPDQSEMSALIDVKIGEDVASYKYAIAEGALSDDDAFEYALGIIDESIESTNATEGGLLQITLENSGEYTFVAVAFDNTGEPQTYTSTVFEFSSGSRLTPEQFEATIKVLAKDESSATIQITPNANYLAYDWGLASKSLYNQIVSLYGSFDVYRTALIANNAENYGMTVEEFIETAGIANKGVSQRDYDDISPDLDLVVWAYAIDSKTGKRLSQVYTLEFATDPMPELLPEYEKWIGTWTVTSTSSWQSGTPGTMDIVIEAKKGNLSYNVYEWGPNVLALEDLWDEYVPFIADFENGKLSICNQVVAELTNGGTISLCGFSTEFGSVFTGEGLQVMTGDFTGDTTAVIDGAKEEIAGFDYFVVSSSGLSIVDTIDCLSGPYYLEKQPDTATASVKKANRANGDFEKMRMITAVRKNANRQINKVSDVLDGRESVSKNSISLKKHKGELTAAPQLR